MPEQMSDIDADMLGCLLSDLAHGNTYGRTPSGPALLSADDIRDIVTFLDYLPNITLLACHINTPGDVLRLFIDRAFDITTEGMTRSLLQIIKLHPNLDPADVGALESALIMQATIDTAPHSPIDTP